MLTLSWRRVVFEIRTTLRDRNAVIFSVLFPLFLLVLFGSVFGHQEIANTRVTIAAYLVPGLVASGLLYSAFQLLAISATQERRDGTLTRFYLSPMPRSVYFVGKLGLSVFVYVVQIALLMGAARALFAVRLPSGGGWWTLTWVSVLGLASSALLGLAMSTGAKTVNSASAITVPVVLFFQFTSGVYFVYTDLPQWMQRLAAIFPLKWLAQALRSVFLPARFGHFEAAGTFELARCAQVLGLWVLIAVVLAGRTFRWRPASQ